MPLFAGWFLAFAGCGIFQDCHCGPDPVVRDGTRQFEKEVVSWKSIRQAHIVMQQHEYSCGSAALATLIKYHWGDNVTEAQFLETILESFDEETLKDRITNGLSMTDLRKAAVKHGYLASMGKRTLKQMTELKIPVIVRIVDGQFEHFVVYRGIVDDRVYLADPIRGNLRLPIEHFAQQWTDGVILVVVKKDTKSPEDSPLLHLPNSPAQIEYQAARRSLYIHNALPRVRRPQ